VVARAEGEHREGRAECGRDHRCAGGLSTV
jgi:hypothetical protein